MICNDLRLKIRDLWKDAICNIDDMATSLPPKIVTKIKDIRTCFVDYIEDMWVWKESLDGQYSTKSVYHWLHSRIITTISQNTMELDMETSHLS